MMANTELSLKLVQLNDLIAHTAEEAYKDLQTLTQSNTNESDGAKTRALLQHLHTTKQRLQRLHILLQWCHKAPAVAECKRVLQAAAAHSDAFRDAADQLAYIHNELQYSMVPAYDVPTAFHILKHHGFSGLPTIIEDELEMKSTAPPPTTSSGVDALHRMDFLIRCKLKERPLPDEVRVLRVCNGQVVVESVSKQWTATLSLVPSPDDVVTLVKWSPPGGGARDEEVVQRHEPQKDVQAIPATEDVKVASAVAAEASCWRWRLVSFEILPLHSRSMIPTQLMAWLQKNVEDRMWAAADIEQLSRLGRRDLVVVFPPPLTRKQRDQRRRERDEAGRSAPAVGRLDPSHADGGMGDHASEGMLRLLRPGMTSSSAGGATSTAGTGAGTGAAADAEVGTPGVIPSWASSPLAAMHAVLHSVSGRLAVGMELVEQAKALEQGSWAGLLKIRRPDDRLGVRLSFWPHVPLLSYHEMVAIGIGGKEDTRIEEPTASITGCTLDVLLSDTGLVYTRPIPALRSLSTGDCIEISPWTPDGAMEAEHLLLKTTSQYAHQQLEVLSCILLDIEKTDGRGCAWCLEHGTLGSAVPALHLNIYEEDAHRESSTMTLLSVVFGAKDGVPTLVLGPGVLEDGNVIQEAQHVVRRAQQTLDRRIAESMVQTLDPGVSRGRAWMHSLAEVVVQTWRCVIATRQKAAIAGAAYEHGLEVATMPRCLSSPVAVSNGGDGGEGRQLEGQQSGQSFPPQTTLCLALPSGSQAHDISPDHGRGGRVCYVMVDVGAGADGRSGLSLAVCHSTAGGIPTEVTTVVLIPAQSGSDNGRSNGEGKKSGPKRKRSDSDAPTTAMETLNSIKWGDVVQWCMSQLAK